MHYFEIPWHTQSMIACMILTEYFWKNSIEEVHCGNVVKMPYFTNMSSLHPHNKGYVSGNSSPFLQIDKHIGWLIWLNKIFYPWTTHDHTYISNNYTSLCLIMIMDSLKFKCMLLLWHRPEQLQTCCQQNFSLYQACYLYYEKTHVKNLNRM